MKHYNNLSVLIIILGLCVQTLLCLHNIRKNETSAAMQEDYFFEDPTIPANHHGTGGPQFQAFDKAPASPIHVPGSKSAADNEGFMTKSISGIVL